MSVHLIANSAAPIFISVEEIIMWTDKDFWLLHHKLGDNSKLVDRIYSLALHEATLPGDVISLITTYNKYTNGLPNLVRTYDCIKKLSSSIARSTFSAVRMQYDSFVDPRSCTGSIYEVTPQQYLCSGALALVSLRGLLPYMSEDCRVNLASLIRYNFKRKMTREVDPNDEFDILNAKMLVLAGFEDCVELFDKKERPKVCEQLERYRQEIDSILPPGEERHKVEDYEKHINPRSEDRRDELEKMVTEVRNWILPSTDKAKNLDDNAWYNQVDTKVDENIKKIHQDLDSGSIAELAYFVTCLAATIQDCYKKDTRLGAGELGKYDSGSDVSPT